MKILLFVMALICCRCDARELNENDLFRLASVLSDNLYIGKIINIIPQKNSRVSYFKISIETPDGLVSIFSRDKFFIDEYNPGDSRYAFLTKGRTDSGDDGGILLLFPNGGVFSLKNVTDYDVSLARAYAKEAALRYIKGGSCEKKYGKLINSLAGFKQQRIIDLMYKERPLTSNQLICLLDSLSSDQALKIKEIKVPWEGWEGVYHHNYNRLGDLVSLLLPHLTNFPIIYDGDISVDRLYVAWAYWGSIKFEHKNP